MNEITLFIRLVIGLMLISSAIQTMLNFKTHILLVENYKIIPLKFVKLFSIIELIFKSIFSALLIMGIFQKVSASFIIFLLFIYTLAILINLLRKRKNISCGCGGIIGNHNLSWFLILRNFILIMLTFFLTLKKTPLASIEALIWEQKSFTEIFSQTAFLIIIMSVIFIITIMIVNALFVARNLMNEFLSIVQLDRKGG